MKRKFQAVLDQTRIAEITGFDEKLIRQLLAAKALSQAPSQLANNLRNRRTQQ